MIFNNIDKVKEHLKVSELLTRKNCRKFFQNDEQSIERAIILLEDIWNDNSLSQNDSSSIASNDKNIFCIEN